MNIINHNRFPSLPDGRSYLPEDTVVELAGSGGRYRITGEPIGYGGSGILYPGLIMVHKESGWTDGTLKVAIKECFPCGLSPAYGRIETGEISNNGESSSLYEYAKEMLFRESEVTGRIYTKGFRLTPVQRTAGEEIIQLPGKPEALVHNAMGILERLDEKGRPLSGVISDYMSGWQCFHIFGLVLRAIGEVHEAHYLHGDIQEHNIFVKGWEEDERTCEISLVDFGSTRELMEDGATAVIADKTLFTTKGYAAPECAEGNDGTLRLTPAADLYSAGILLLRMLNGRLPDRRALQLSVGSRFLLQKRARVIRIPSGTVPKINELLAGLLQNDPDKRYQTVQDVLEISERIEKALSPRTSSLEATDFDAFISYCHEPVASVAAERIQRKLENYRIPKTVKRPDGKLVMGKVFLDRTEMTSDGDMGDHLRSALAHSAFLIVILSPEAKESPWVEREIRMFLETHSRDQILTVLAEGEPEDVTPPVLLESEREIDGVMKKSAVESLAADLRGRDDRERRKKLNTEVYRVLAPILGCGFDDLVQRQKAYRQQKMIHILTAAFIVSICILGIIGRQAYIIQRNYLETLKRDSINLARESNEALEKGDRKEAVALALESLPDPEHRSDRPVTGQAKAALIRSMGFYQGENLSSYLGLRPDRVLQMEFGATTSVLEYPEELERMNQEKTCIASADKMGTVYAWDLSDGSLLRKWTQEEIQAAEYDYLSENSWGPRDAEADTVECLAFQSEHTIIIATELAYMEADIQSGKLTVKDRYPVYRPLYSDAASDHKIYPYIYTVLYMEKLHALVLCTLDDDQNGSWRFDILDLNSGKILSTFTTDSILGEESSTFQSLYDVKVVGDGSCLSITMSCISESKSRLLLWDPQKDRSCQADLEDTSINYVGIVDDDAIAVVSSNHGYPDYASGQFPDTELSLIELSDGSCRFHSHIDSRIEPVEGKRRHESIGLFACMIGENEYIWSWCGKKIYLFTAADGKEVLSTAADADVCDIVITSNQQLCLCTKSGEIFTLDIAGELSKRTEVKTQTDHFLYDPEYETACMINRQEGKIIVLRPEIDDRCQTVDISDKTGITIGSDAVVFFQEINSGETRLSLYKPDSLQEAAEDIKLLPDDPVTQWNVEHFEKGVMCSHMYLYWQTTKGHIKMTARSTEDGKIIWEKTLENAAPSGWFAQTNADAVDEEGKKLLYDTTDGFALLNLENGENILQWSLEEFIQDQKLREKMDYVWLPKCWEELHITRDGACIIGLYDNGKEGDTLCVLDIEKNEWLTLPEEVANIRFGSTHTLNKYVFVTDSRRYAAVHCEPDRQIIIIDTTDWSICSRISYVAVGERYLYLSPDDRFLIISEETNAQAGTMTVQVRDIITGAIVSEITGETTVNVDMDYKPEHGMLRVGSQTCNFYFLTEDGQLVPLWERKSGTFVENMFVSLDKDKAQFRFYPLRSVEAMIAEAKERYAL